jgi:hypothetical protein
MRNSLYIFTLSLLVSISSSAYIPRIQMILDRVSDNAGRGIYQIDQDVFFSLGSAEPIVLHETWTIENEGSLKLLVTGTRELKDTLRWNFLYSNSSRFYITNQGKNSKPLTEDFSERWFSFRKSENLMRAILQSGWITTEELRAKTTKQESTFVYPPQPSLRLSRTGGIVSWAIGRPNSSESSSGLWIEQDQFIIRKIKTTTNAEIVADNYSNYARGLQLPRTKKISWDDKNVQIQLVSVSSPAIKTLAPQLEVSQGLALPSNIPEKTVIEEFYKRFR